MDIFSWMFCCNYIYTHTHNQVLLYLLVCVCVCVCMYVFYRLDPKGWKLVYRNNLCVDENEVGCAIPMLGCNFFL